MSTKLYAMAKDVAYMLIDEEGASPEALSVAELSGERAEMHDLDSNETEELEALVWRLLGAAVTTITFPDEGEL